MIINQEQPEANQNFPTVVIADYDPQSILSS